MSENEIRKNNSRNKVKEAVNSLKLLMELMDTKTAEPKDFSNTFKFMNAVKSTDLMCCKEGMLNEIVVPIQKAVTNYSLPSRLHGITDLMLDKVQMYINTRNKQADSGRQSGQLVKEKHTKLGGLNESNHDADMLIGSLIESMENVADMENPYDDMSLKLLQDLRESAHKLLGKVSEWEVAKLKKALIL